MFADAIETDQLVNLFSIFLFSGQLQNAFVETFQFFHGLVVLNQVFFKSFLENGIVEALCF